MLLLQALQITSLVFENGLLSGFWSCQVLYPLIYLMHACCLTQAIATLLQEDTSAIVTLQSSGLDRPSKLDSKIYASYAARWASSNCNKIAVQLQLYVCVSIEAQ